ncbi:hypothetical protein Gogos_010793, partial [Gossypium gossypioides]|nr:hypothetical protein [Gossypium gossypioides]
KARLWRRPECVAAVSYKGGAATSTSASVNSGSGSNMVRFYTDDALGFKISPTVVLVMSLCFIAFVAALDVFGKIYRAKDGGGP